MDLAQFVDVVLHLDRHLEAVVARYGAWVHAILFAIIFVETGPVLMPFLPGDSLRFVCGAIAATGGLSLAMPILLPIRAAVLGDAVNDAVGGYFGPKCVLREARPVHPHRRALPALRADLRALRRRRRHDDLPGFALYNVVGGVLWVASLAVLGYLVGNLPWVKELFSRVALALIVIPGLPASRRRRPRQCSPAQRSASPSAPQPRISGTTPTLKRNTATAAATPIAAATASKRPPVPSGHST
jgi:membrane-associated protein